MIITRTPLRITLGGGGTDLPSYYREAGHGFLIAAAISKYVYVAVNRNFDEDIKLKYSEIEEVPIAREVQHPILRECLALTNIERGIELSSMADIPTGTGLGSSGAFTVGVLKALYANLGKTIDNTELARQACEIEIERLGEPIGKQDQYIAAIGGLTALRFNADESVDATPVDIPPEARLELDDNLVMFYTGVRRSASDELAEQQTPKPASKTSLRDNLDQVRAIGYDTLKTLEAGDLHAFGNLLTTQWELKYERARSKTHEIVDNQIKRGIDAGAVGGKLIGAGGGGFLLFYAEQKAKLRDIMKEIGLEEVRFHLDYEGAHTVSANL